MSNHRELKEVHLPLMQVVGMHRARYPALSGLIHVPNEMKRTQAQGGILVAMGMRAGVHDLLLLRPRRGYHGLTLELKAPGKINAMTDPQKSFAREMFAEGWLVASSDCPASAWSLIRWYVDGGIDPACMVDHNHKNLRTGPFVWEC